MSHHLRSKKMGLFDSTGARRHSWTDTTENGPGWSDGKPQIPTESTRADGWIGGRGAGTDLARSGASPGPTRAGAGAAGQSRQRRPPPQRPGHADLVAARPRTSLQAW